MSLKMPTVSEDFVEKYKAHLRENRDRIIDEISNENSAKGIDTMWAVLDVIKKILQLDDAGMTELLHDISWDID